MSLTELEYPLSDLPPHLHFAGCPSRNPVPSDYHNPNWWPEIEGSGSQKIVIVTQGTVACDWEDLLVPTLSGLKNRDDLLVVATLALLNARLACDINVPVNGRVQDHLPFDAVLQHADVFVTDGGYDSGKQISPPIPYSFASYLLACTDDDILVCSDSWCGQWRTASVGGASTRQMGSQHACGMSWAWHQ